MDCESLWADIDHAERCLVSAMYEEALEVASSTLRTLCKEARNEFNRWVPARDELSTEGDDCAELVTMVEAAGMVLLQALNQMGRINVQSVDQIFASHYHCGPAAHILLTESFVRSCDLFDELISFFDFVGKVPYSLILTGTCLQLSMGVHPISQAALEEYLSGWKSAECNADGLMVKVAQVSPNKQKNDNCSTAVNDTDGSSYVFYLSRTDYLQLTEVYAIEILAKAYKNVQSASFWIVNSSISEEDKQVILAKLQLLAQSQKPGLSSTKHSKDKICETTVSEPVQKTREEMARVGSLKEEMMSSIESSPTCKDHITWMASEESKSKFVVRGSGIWRFPFVRTVLSLLELFMIRLSGSAQFKWASRHRKLPQRTVLVKGALISGILYLLLRKRTQLTRWVTEMVNLAIICFSDLWQLAFSVHLNPLAAVQPLPSGRLL